MKTNTQSDMVVFETNLKTVHERCCKLRDEEDDFSEFDKCHESELFQKCYREGRREFRFSGLWWAIDEVQLTASGWAMFTYRYGNDLVSFSRHSFRFCQPSEVPEKIAREKELLNYWVEPATDGQSLPGGN